MGDWVDQQLGSYRLTQLLGEGGFARVYLGEHLHLGTLAAIKVLTAKIGPQEIADFLQEARTIAQLRHPNIIQVHDFKVEDGVPYLVMDYATHGSLRQRHPKGEQLAPTAILRYVQQVASALQHAHERKLVHRDVKPENMLLSERNEVLLSDFGIAIVAQSSRLQSTQAAAGTLTYMAPEQGDGHPRPASDQYSLGIVIYEWLTGAPPFRGTPIEILSQHVKKQPPLREKLPGISSALEEVVLTALAKDPHDRFKNMQAFAAAFENACQSAMARPITPLPAPAPPAAPPPAAPPPDPAPTLPAVSPPALPPTLRQPPAPAPQATLIVPPERSPANLPRAAGATPPGVQGARLTPPQPLEPPPATWKAPPAANNTPLAASPAVATPQPAPPVPAPRKLSRRKVLIGAAGVAGLVVAGGATAAGLVLTRKAPGAAAPGPAAGPGTTVYLTYRGHSDNVNALSWSPNGQQIASGSSDKTVQVWDASSGISNFTFRQHTTPVFGVVWSPQGTRIASGSRLGLLLVWAPTQGTIPQQLGDVQHGGLAGQSMSGLAWSPDGTRIAAEAIIGGVAVWEVSSGKQVFVYPGHFGPIHSVAWEPEGQRVASGSDDLTVQVWDATNGRQLLVYQHHTEPVTSVGWSADKQHIASGGLDKTVQVWDAATGTPIYTYRGHTAEVWALKWSPDGRRIASASSDGTVQVWDALTGQHRFTYRGHSGPVLALAWSPNGAKIASGGTDKTTQVWQAR